MPEKANESTNNVTPEKPKAKPIAERLRAAIEGHVETGISLYHKGETILTLVQEAWETDKAGLIAEFQRLHDSITESNKTQVGNTKRVLQRALRKATTGPGKVTRSFRWDGKAKRYVYGEPKAPSGRAAPKADTAPSEAFDASREASKALEMAASHAGSVSEPTRAAFLRDLALNAVRRYFMAAGVGEEDIAVFVDRVEEMARQEIGRRNPETKSEDGEDSETPAVPGTEKEAA